MKIDEIIRAVSDKSGVEPPAVQKVLETAFALLGEELAREEKVELQGLGTFIRKNSGTANRERKTLFKSWSATGAREKTRKTGKSRKKTRKKTRKAKNGSSP